MSKVITLSKPVQAHGAEVNELTLRDVETKDVLKIGFPFLATVSDSGGAGIEFRAKIVAKYISECAGIPPSSVEKLALSDLSKLQNHIQSFFSEGSEGE